MYRSSTLEEAEASLERLGEDRLSGVRRFAGLTSGTAGKGDR